MDAFSSFDPQLVLLDLSLPFFYGYKQITEGLEDQARFDVMVKVGLSDRMIRQSVNSQMLTVFFLPLIASGSEKE